MSSASGSGGLHNLELPVFGNVKTPFEGQVFLPVVVNEARDCVIVAPCEHAGGRFLFLDYSSVEGQNRPAWEKARVLLHLHFLV